MNERDLVRFMMKFPSAEDYWSSGEDNLPVQNAPLSRQVAPGSNTIRYLDQFNVPATTPTPVTFQSLAKKLVAPKLAGGHATEVVTNENLDRGGSDYVKWLYAQPGSNKERVDAILADPQSPWFRAWQDSQTVRR